MKNFRKTLSLFLSLSMIFAFGVTAFREDASSDTTTADNNAAADTATVYVAETGGNKYATVAEAVEAAADGGTVTILVPGSYTAYHTFTSKKSLTFVGTGTNTVWYIGAEVPDPTLTSTEYNGDYSFDGADTITFKNMTLNLGKENYLGFIRVNNFNVENCTINGKITYNGNKTATYTNVIFNAPDGDYSFQIVNPTDSITFTGCTFNGSGKFINVYKDYGAGTYETTVNLENCTANSTKANKSLLNIKDNNHTYHINISGTNTLTGFTPNSTTCSRLFMVEVTSSGADYSADVKIDGKTVWTDGKMVNHEIDCTNDKYTDGYEDNAYDTTTSDWASANDGGEFRTVTKICRYCKATVVDEEYRYTVSFEMNDHGDAVDSQKVMLNETASQPDAPSRSGWTFGGWYTDSTFSTKYDFSTAIASDTTLYAKWTKRSSASGESSPSTGTAEKSPDTSDITAEVHMTEAVTLAILAAGFVIIGRRKRA